jgi:hypothetical protein
VDWHTAAVGDEPFIGSEALASGKLTPYALRSLFIAVHHDVNISKTLSSVLWYVRKRVGGGRDDVVCWPASRHRLCTAPSGSMQRDWQWSSMTTAMLQRESGRIPIGLARTRYL